MVPTLGHQGCQYRESSMKCSVVTTARFQKSCKVVGWYMSNIGVGIATAIIRQCSDIIDRYPQSAHFRINISIVWEAQAQEIL